MRRRRIESDAEGRCGDGHSRQAIFHRHDDYTASIPKFDPEIKNRCTQEGVNGEILASIPKFGPEIKNRCTKEGVNGEKLTSIPKFGPEIKNRCTKEGVNGEKLTSIPKSGPEIKNRCSQEGVNRQNLAAIPKFTTSNQESLQEVAHLQHAPSARPKPRSHPAPPTF